jgi:Arc/MetJ-type ribon-helix-helix transcriptional regulator
MPSGGTVGNKGGSGRPVTIHGDTRVTVRVSRELLDKVTATTEAQHVSRSEAIRLVLQLLADSPGDVVAAMKADPQAARTVFVKRAAKTVRLAQRRRGG